MSKKILFTIIAILTLIIINLFSIPSVSEESNNKILYVGGEKTENYKTIQDAINDSKKGDTILVYNGTYNENLVINKSINLFGENKETTIINGENYQDVITIQTLYVNISGFTIENGSFSGIFLDYFGNCRIYKNNINNNSIGLYLLGSANSEIFNNTISNNSNYGLKTDKITPIDDEEINSENNTIYHNDFINNSENALDECSNLWSYKNQGNYWDDYKGLDKNNDGIGDNSYIITEEKSKDDYPLMMPYIGKLRIKEFYIDEGQLYKMLAIAIVVAIIFCLPIGYIWYRKYYKVK